MGRLFYKIKKISIKIRHEITALTLAYKDPRTPWYAKVMALIVIAYAVSPIDLIPDFIPIIGYLDDLILVPLGIFITIKLIPSNVMAECRERAKKTKPNKKTNYTMAVIIVSIWILILLYFAWLVFKIISSHACRR